MLLLLLSYNINADTSEKLPELQTQRKLGLGGPDGCGYMFASAGDAAINYNYIDITPHGTKAFPSSRVNGETGDIPIGFVFPFYDIQ